MKKTYSFITIKCHETFSTARLFESLSLRSSLVFGNLPDLQSALIYTRIVGACAKRKSLEVAQSQLSCRVPWPSAGNMNPLCAVSSFCTRLQRTGVLRTALTSTCFYYSYHSHSHFYSTPTYSNVTWCTDKIQQALQTSLWYSMLSQ